MSDKKYNGSLPGFTRAPNRGGTAFGPFYRDGKFGIERTEVSEMHERVIAGRDAEESAPEEGEPEQ